MKGLHLERNVQLYCMYYNSLGSTCVEIKIFHLWFSWTCSSQKLEVRYHEPRFLVFFHC